MIRQLAVGGLCVLGVLLLGLWSAPTNSPIPGGGKVARAAVPATPGITPPPCGAPFWAYTADYPTTVAEAAVVSLDAFIYSFGNGAYKYSVNANTWTAITSPPAPSGQQGASAVTDGTYIYLLNGYSSGVLNRLYRYDPLTDSYTTLAAPPTATASQAAVYLNGKIYRIAGGTGAGYTAGVDVYTLSTDTWAPAGTVAAYPQAISYVLAVAYNGYIYAGGGGGVTVQNLTTKTYRYDPAANAWDDNAVPDFRQAHYGGASSIADGYWMLAGGYDIAYQIDRNVELLPLYNPNLGWFSMPWLPAWRFLTSGATVAGVFYVVGGFSTGINPHQEVQYLNPGCASIPPPPPTMGSPTRTPTPAPTNTVTPTSTLTPTSTPTSCSTSAWNPSDSYPIPVAGAAVAAQGGTVYSFGGYANEAAVANAYRYTPGNLGWAPIAPLPEARAFASAVSDGTYLYILNGGETTLQSRNALYRYDPATDSYSTLAAPPVATYGQAIAYLNGKIYRIAGHYSHYGPIVPNAVMRAGTASAPTNDYEVNTVDVYTISSNSWAPAGTIANYPLLTSNLNAVVYNGYIYTAGGGGNSSPVTNKTYRYDPVAGSWDDAAVPDLPTGRQGSAMDLLNGRWIVAGGSAMGGLPNPTTEVLALDLTNPTATWATLASLPTAEIYSSGARVGNNFYVVGGINMYPPGANSIVQRYTDGPPCPTSPTATATASSTMITTTLTPFTTGTPTATPPTAAATGTPTATATLCPLRFSDVQATDYFAPAVRALACRGVISGYSDGTFRPYNPTTRAQLVKIVVLGLALPVQTPAAAGYTFSDVLPTDTFYPFVETAAARSIISGYTCGTVAGEPCDSGHRPYFRPVAPVTRGQVAKIVVVGAGWATVRPAVATFNDVAPGNVFYPFVETAVCRGVLDGYTCGGPGDPCPGRYFHPVAGAVRGQIAKIVYNSAANPPVCAP